MLRLRSYRAAPPRRRPFRAAARTARPRLEQLEGRCVPAAFLVSTAAGSGPGSLRDAITAADAGPGPSVITFDPALNGQTIALSSGALPTITADGLTIQGPGANFLTVAGNHNDRVLAVSASGVTISGLTITGGGSGLGFGVNSGGGITNSGSLTLLACVVAQNGVLSEGFPASGGGIENSGTMTISNCAITGNAASGKVGSRGGGIDNQGQMTVVDSTVSGNTAGGPFLTVAGGGISNSGTLALFRCTVSGNQVSSTVGSPVAGGGIATLGSGQTTVVNCTIAGNTAPAGGGVEVLGGALALANCTVAQNVGGGVALGSGAPAVGMQNTIMAQNQSGPDVSGAVQSGGDNLVGNPAGATGLQPGDLTNLDPLLGPLQANGGPTQTMALLPGSPAIDAGNNAAPGLPATDQRGFKRVFNGRVDIGAFEFGSLKPAAVGAFDPATATWYLRSSVGAGAPDAGQFAFGGAGWLPVAGDWAGSGHSGIGAFDPATATWYLRNELSAGAPDAGVFRFGGSGCLPVAGDWQGSGHAGVGAFDPATATWYLRNEADAGAPDAGVFRFGVTGIPVVGDWTGTGHLGIGVFDPATATWYLRSSTSAGAPDAGVFQYGGTGWLPVAGDWLGAGHSGVGAFDPATATWYLRSEPNAGAPDAGQFAFGGAGWLPVVGAFPPAVPSPLAAAATPLRAKGLAPTVPHESGTPASNLTGDVDLAALDQPFAAASPRGARPGG
jgi:hypothetical protein